MTTVNCGATEIIAQEIYRRQADLQREQDVLDTEQRILAGKVEQWDADLQKWERAYLADAIDVQDFKIKRAEVRAARESLTREMEEIDAKRQQLSQLKLRTVALVISFAIFHPCGVFNL